MNCYCAVSMQDLSETNLQHLSICFLTVKQTFFAVTETWLTPNDITALAELSVPGYKLLHCPRSNLRGGGAALFF